MPLCFEMLTKRALGKLPKSNRSNILNIAIIPEFPNWRIILRGFFYAQRFRNVNKGGGLGEMVMLLCFE
ncbi:MAG TPA: hypothetical protein DD791_09375 [Syntrophomonas sp.]|mgnify:CR=1 FL=1|jgi:hypothetical protein|nr:hypothetical protein [Syntrophomonas sp.]